MTSDDTIIYDGDGDQDDALTVEWVTSLRDDGPETTSELVLVPGWTQSEWDRRQVAQLNLAHQAETYLWDNLHKTGPVLVRDLLLLLGRTRAAAAHMAGAEVDRNTQVYVHPGSGLPPVHVVLEGEIRYAHVPPPPADERVKAKAPAKPAAKVATGQRRQRPSRARKTVTGGT